MAETTVGEGLIIIQEFNLLKVLQIQQVFGWMCYPYRAYIQNEHYTTSDNACLNEEIPYLKVYLNPIYDWSLYS